MLQYNDHDQNYKAYEKVFKRTVILCGASATERADSHTDQ